MTIFLSICDNFTPRRPFYVKLYCQIASLKMTNIMPRVNNDCDDKRLEVSDVSTCYQRQSRNLPVSSLSTVSSLSSPLYSLHLCGHSYSLFFMLTISDTSTILLNTDSLFQTKVILCRSFSAIITVSHQIISRK